MNKLTILGAGSWGTALASVAALKGIDTCLWCRKQEQARLINETGKNPRYLSTSSLPSGIHSTSDLKRATTFASNWIIAIPTQGIRELLKKTEKNNLSDISICNVSKGLEISTLKRISQIVKEIHPQYDYTVLSGPSHAEEVIKGLPTALVSASEDPDTATKWQQGLNGETFRIYTSDDVCGVETGGALKNVIAIASGLCHSMKMGDNATAALVSRGLAEIMRMSVAMGGHPITLAGLAGIGDLMVTAYSRHSRNFRLGEAIGRGKNLEEAIEELGQVAEGAYTVKAAVKLGKKLKVELPISEAIYSVLYGEMSSEQALKSLMSRDPKPEYPAHIFKKE